MFGRGYFILDDNGEPQHVDDLQEWARWYETADRRIAQDMDEGHEGADAGRVKVSTVFLGLDHRHWGEGPPILWETMVFGGVLDGTMDRYTSKEDALLGHQAMCERVMATIHRPGERGND